MTKRNIVMLRKTEQMKEEILGDTIESYIDKIMKDVKDKASVDRYDFLRLARLVKKHHKDIKEMRELLDVFLSRED